MCPSNIFIWGVLANEDAIFLATRCQTPTRPAMLENYQESRSSSGQPAIKAKRGSKVEGILITDPDETFLKRLDAYYGPNYERRPVSVIDGKSERQAVAYFRRRDTPLPEGSINTSDLDSLQLEALEH